MIVNIFAKCCYFRAVLIVLTATTSFLYDAGPGLSKSSPYNMIFHPSTGLCIVTNSQLKQLQLGQCAESTAWRYTRQKKLMLRGTKYCLQPEGVSKPAKLGFGCKVSSAKWHLISSSKMHISSNLTNNGNNVCLDIDDNGTIMTNQCKCLSLDGTCNPGSQWFKIIRSSREVNDQILKRCRSQFAQVEQLYPDDWRKHRNSLA